MALEKVENAKAFLLVQFSNILFMIMLGPMQLGTCVQGSYGNVALQTRGKTKEGCMA